MRIATRVILLPLILFSLVGGNIHAQSDDAVVALRVLAMGGIVERDDKRPGRPVVAVELGPAIADGNLSFLHKARQLRRLKLHSAKITDASAAELARFIEITELDLRSPNITGTTIAQLGRLTSLQTLTLGLPKLKDKDLRIVEVGPNMRLLSGWK